MLTALQCAQASDLQRSDEDELLSVAGHGAGPRVCGGYGFHGGERLTVADMARRGRERGQRGRMKHPEGRGGAEEKPRGVVVASVMQASREVGGVPGARALSPSSAYWQR